MPRGFRPPTPEEQAGDVEKRRIALEQAERDGSMSKPQLEQAWMELSSFEGYARVAERQESPLLEVRDPLAEDPLVGELRRGIERQVQQISEWFQRGLGEAEEKQVVAYMRARGYLVVRPSDQLSDPQRKIAEQSRLIDVLRDTIATLRRGGSTAPTSAEG